MKRSNGNLNLKNCFEVGREGMRGGLALLRNLDVTLHIQSYNKHHIGVMLNGVY